MKTLNTKALSLEIMQKCNNVNKRMWIASPFVGGVNKVLSILGAKFALTKGLDLKLLVDTSDIQNCSYPTLNSLMDLGFEVKTLTGLHAKIYVIDNDCIVTSANLTHRAFTRKYEIGISLDKTESNEAIKTFIEFFKEGTKVNRFKPKEIEKQKHTIGRGNGAERGGDMAPFLDIKDPESPYFVLSASQRRQALRNFTQQNRVWKISLGRRWTEGLVYESCIRTDTIAIGWIDDRDVTGWEFNRLLSTLNRVYPGRIRTSSANSMYYFNTKMQSGDLVLVYESRNTIRAIGVVDGNYYWNSKLVDLSAHRRDVIWLAHGCNLNIHRINDNKELGDATLYPLDVINHDEIKNLIFTL